MISHSHIDINIFKKKLLDEKRVLLHDADLSVNDRKTVTLDQTSVGRLSRMDAMQSQEMALETERRREIELNRIEQALARIKNGEYGFCQSCDEEISKKRLEIDPATPICINCASKASN
ncbi:MAG: TraR/DksA C4-type zinc finger protein [Rhodospirillaceae bacterium]|nr:TraR/DksA C4-type zinc finger protein [Rhodospirillaceae bacterium]